ADRAGHGLPPESTEELARLRDQVARLRTLLRGLEAHARAGRVVEHVEDVDLVEVMRSARDRAAPPAGVDVIVPATAPIVRTARASLEQVLVQLLRDAIERHGAAASRVVLAWRDAGALVEIAVSDDAP